MCYFEQTRFACGSWKWGEFRVQCTKEYRTGETCGLKLVFSTNHVSTDCMACISIAKKQRRIKKMTADMERWQREGNRPATLEMTKSEVAELQISISLLWERHLEGFPARSRRWKQDRVT